MSETAAVAENPPAEKNARKITHDKGWLTKVCSGCGAAQHAKRHNCSACGAKLKVTPKKRVKKASRGPRAVQQNPFLPAIKRKQARTAAAAQPEATPLVLDAAAFLGQSHAPPDSTPTALVIPTEASAYVRPPPLALADDQPHVVIGDCSITINNQFIQFSTGQVVRDFNMIQALKAAHLPIVPVSGVSEFACCPRCGNVFGKQALKLKG